MNQNREDARWCLLEGLSDGSPSYFYQWRVASLESDQQNCRYQLLLTDGRFENLWVEDAPVVEIQQQISQNTSLEAQPGVIVKKLGEWLRDAKTRTVQLTGTDRDEQRTLHLNAKIHVIKVPWEFHLRQLPHHRHCQTFQQRMTAPLLCTLQQQHQLALRLQEELAQKDRTIRALLELLPGFDASKDKRKLRVHEFADRDFVALRDQITETILETPMTALLQQSVNLLLDPPAEPAEPVVVKPRIVSPQPPSPSPVPKATSPVPVPSPRTNPSSAVDKKHEHEHEHVVQELQPVETKEQTSQDTVVMRSPSPNTNTTATQSSVVSTTAEPSQPSQSSDVVYATAAKKKKGKRKLV